MRAVLIGADLMYRQDGKLVPIEINTNTGWDRENRVEETLEEIFDLSEFKAFLNSHRITEVWVDGLMSQILVDFFNKEGITAVRKSDQELSEAEDQDNLLLLRTSYSNEALVDSFCRDKALFLDAIKDFDFGCDYVLKTDEGLEGSIAEIVDNGDYPNFILKYRYPYYDIDEYPKLVKITSQKALKKFLNSEEMPVDFLLMPFYFNEDEAWEQEGEKRLKLIRHLSAFVLVDESLEAVPIGTYTKLCGNFENIKCKYSSLGVLDSESRKAFLDTWTTRTVEDVLAEKGDLVLMADDTWKPVEELEVGDEIKSLDVPNEGDVDIRKHTGDYNVNYDTFVEESSYGIGEITAIRKSSRVITKIGLVFTDGTDWWDTANSSYPTLDPEDGTIYFKTLDMMVPGDKVVLLKAENTENPEFEVKELEKIERSRQAVEGYGLSVDGSHLFLTKAPDEESAYVSIEHNEDYPVTCTAGILCESPEKKQEQAGAPETIDLAVISDSGGGQHSTPWGIRNISLIAAEKDGIVVSFNWPLRTTTTGSWSLPFKGWAPSNRGWTVQINASMPAAAVGYLTSAERIKITYGSGTTDYVSLSAHAGVSYTASVPAGYSPKKIEFTYRETEDPFANP